MRNDRVRMSVDDARALGERALRGLGYDAEAAWIIADHVIDAALCGYEYSGLAKILNLPEQPRWKQPRGPMRVLHETPLSVMYDGNNECAMLTMYRATERAIAIAKAQGMALVGVANTWMSGRSAYFAEMIARADLVGIHTAASLARVAPPGGIRPALGTNPIAFGLPSDDGPVVFDMGTSAFMATEVMLRERLGQPIPEGVAIDRHGQPTTDAAEVRFGALLPFGGYKGFGLALMVQAFGVLGGSAIDLDHAEGYVFVVFRPDLLQPLDAAKREVSALMARVKSTPRAPGVDEIRLPSERAFRCRERLRVEGLEFDLAVRDSLEALAARTA